MAPTLPTPQFYINPPATPPPPPFSCLSALSSKRTYLTTSTEKLVRKRCINMQKISSFHLLLLETQPILESCDQTNHTYFWPCPTKTFLIFFLFMWICINMQKIMLFHWSVPEIWLIKKSCYLIAWEHFGPYLRKKHSQIWHLCRNTVNIINFHHRTNSVKINDQIFQ